MANLVNLDGVSHAYGTTTLLDGVSLGVDSADRIGVVGRNGSGKTTLLRILTGDEKPDAGRVTHRSGLRLAYLPQQIVLPADATVGEVVLGTAWQGEGFAAEHEWAGDAAIREVLDGLGMASLGIDSPVGPLSGGERRRIALAALLVRPADLVILDEPTNHLDIAGISWLAAHLLARRRALVAVTHDRWFLDAVSTTTWEVTGGGDGGKVHTYEGGYAAWTLARAERQRLASTAEARRRNLLRKELAWLRRGAPARTSKPKFRIEQANALIADVPAPRDDMSLRRLATARLGRQVYDLTDVTVTVGGRTLLDDVTWRVGPGDRIALLGANGAGKTTLLRLLTGERQPDTGIVATGQTVKPAYLSQELADLPTHLRVLEAVEDVARRVQLGDKDLSASQVAEMFGFASERLWAPVGELSGGERRRLQLLRLLASEPNVLLFDEPTNDLDTDTLAALEDLLDSWPGTVIVASHDRYFTERVCDTVVALLGDGRLRALPGGVDEYLDRVRATDATDTPPATAPPGPSGGHLSRGAASRADAKRRRESQRELNRLERQVTKLQRREADLHGQLATHATDYEKVAALAAELADVRREREAAEEAWLTLADQHPDSL